jgi:hypothetical protein
MRKLGVLYMEHGLAKILDFPHQPNHVPYAPFTLVPGLQGLLELVGDPVSTARIICLSGRDQSHWREDGGSAGL